LFTHKDQIEIPNIDYSSNEMPYFLPTEDGPKWVVTAEPAGSSFGVSKIFIIDAQSGKIEIFEASVWVEREDSEGEYEKKIELIGPNRAWEYAKAAFPMYDWHTEGSSGGNIKLLEPRPIVNDGNFYWMMTVATTQYAFAPGKPSTVLVNAQTTETISFTSELELRTFLAGGVIEPTEPTDGDITQLYEYLETLYQRDQENDQLILETIEKILEILSSNTSQK
jgi:hypothetical protein